MANQPAGVTTTADTPTVQTHAADGVFVITINRPKVRNAVNGVTARALAQAALTRRSRAVFSAESVR